MSSPPSPVPVPGSGEALRARYGARYRWLLLATVMVGVMASIMSSTVVNVAIPGLSHQFALGQERAQWVTSGFMVASTVSMLLTPWLLARFGYRATFNGCMGLLMAGGLLGGPPLQAALLLALAAACLVVFIAWQRRLARRGQAPLMNLALFAWRPFAMGALVALIYGTALFGSTYLLPVYMQMGLGLSASSVGGILMPSGLVLAGAIAVVARLADRTPASGLVMMGLSLLALSFAAMVTIGLSASLWLLMTWSIVGRIGLGFILPSLNLGAMRGLQKDLIAQGSSVINFVRTLGGAAGVGLCGIALEWRLAAHGVALGSGPPSAARLAAFDEVFLMLAVLCAVAMLAARHLGAQSPPPSP